MGGQADRMWWSGWSGWTAILSVNRSFEPIWLSTTSLVQPDLLDLSMSIIELYATRYRPAYDIYDRLCEPERHADAIIDNDDFIHPELQVQPGGRLA
jgi:hypothetical protein